MQKVASAASVFLLFPCFSYAAMDFYESSSRTIYVTFDQPVQSVSVHVVGKQGLGLGKCTSPKSIVNVMEFMPASAVKKDKSISGKISANYKGTNGEIAAQSSSSASYNTPAVYKYNYTGTITQLHYNIAYTRGGKQYALGWRPDSGGGCTYTAP